MNRVLLDLDNYTNIVYFGLLPDVKVSGILFTSNKCISILLKGE
jgi:hypothetical protein